MNPFLEIPLAAPQPGARWRRPPLAAVASGAGDAQAPGIGGRRPAAPCAGAAQPPRSAVRTPPAARLSHCGRLRRVGGILRAVMLAGALLAPGAAAAIDLNAATPEQLQEVKGIGPKMARVIIEERDRGGRFASIDDLADRVKGIGPKKAASLQASGLVVGAAAAGKAVADGGGSGVAASAGRRSR